MAKPSTNKTSATFGEVVKRDSVADKPQAKLETKSGTLKKTSNSDAKGRVVLGPQFANKMFRVSEQADGNVLLEPVVTVHEREVWFYKNPAVQAMVQVGIRQSRAGETVYLGPFGQYADLDVDDEPEG
jgi:hypothetical protein